MAISLNTQFLHGSYQDDRDDLIKAFEGYRSHVYADHKGIATFGYGFDLGAADWAGATQPLLEYALGAGFAGESILAAWRNHDVVNPADYPGLGIGSPQHPRLQLDDNDIVLLSGEIVGKSNHLPPGQQQLASLTISKPEADKLLDAVLDPVNSRLGSARVHSVRDGAGHRAGKGRLGGARGSSPSNARHSCRSIITPRRSSVPGSPPRSTATIARRLGTNPLQPRWREIPAPHPRGVELRRAEEADKFGLLPSKPTTKGVANTLHDLYAGADLKGNQVYQVIEAKNHDQMNTANPPFADQLPDALYPWISPYFQGFIPDFVVFGNAATATIPSTRNMSWRSAWMGPAQSSAAPQPAWSSASTDQHRWPVATATTLFSNSGQQTRH